MSEIMLGKTAPYLKKSQLENIDVIKLIDWKSTLSDKNDLLLQGLTKAE